MSERMEGGCQCGAVRFAAMVADDDAYLCHCRMCQRSSGSVSIAFKGFPRASVTWLSPPTYYVSSPIAKRGFCSTCGTSLSFEYLDGDDMDLMVATFDDPARFVPRSHFGVATRLDHWRNVDGLPEARIEDNAPTVERWINAIGKLPD